MCFDSVLVAGIPAGVQETCLLNDGLENSSPTLFSKYMYSDHFWNTLLPDRYFKKL